MVGISKCGGIYYDGPDKVVCPQRAQCFRYTAPDGGITQSYFCVAPLKREADGTMSCKFFRPEVSVSP